MNEPDRAPFASSSALAGLDVLDLQLRGGAGGVGQLAGDYVFGNHREAYREAGQWGILRVLDCNARKGEVTSLPGRRCNVDSRGLSTVPISGLAAAGLLVAAAVAAHRRRRAQEGASPTSRLTTSANGR